MTPDIKKELNKLDLLDKGIGSQQMTIQVTSIIYFVKQTIEWMQGDLAIVEPSAQISFFYESNK